MSVCPNVNLPEWKALEARVGKFEAFKDFMENNFEIRDPEVVAAKVANRKSGDFRESYQLTRTTSDGRPASVEVVENLAQRLAAKFGEEYNWRVENKEDVAWKGYVEPGNANNGNRPTIVINAAKATLDTPIHEFGHIFLEMIKAGNLTLFSRLMTSQFNKLISNPEYKALWEETQSLYLGKTIGGRQMTIDDVKEEFLVEMLGRFGAEQVDPGTGAYKALQEIWDAVKKFIKDILTFSEPNTVDVVDIKPDTPLETLATMLVGPENTRFKVGGKQREETLSDITRARKKLDEATSLLNKLSAYNNSDLVVGYYDEFGRGDSLGTRGRLIVMTKEAADRIRVVRDNWDKLGNYLTLKFKEDGQKLYEWLKTQSGTPDEIFQKLMQETQFNNFMKIMNFEERAMEQLKNDIARVSQGRSLYRTGADLATYVSLKDHFKPGWQTDPNKEEKRQRLLVEGILNRNRSINKLIGHEALYTQTGERGTSVFDLQMQARSDMEDQLRQLNDLENNGTTSGTRVFKFEFTHPETGEVEVDEIMVRASRHRRAPLEAEVVFSSKNWQFADVQFALGRDPKVNDVVAWTRNANRASLQKTMRNSEDVNDFLSVTETRGKVVKVNGDKAYVKFKNRPYQLREATAIEFEGDLVFELPLSSLTTLVSQNRQARVMPYVMDAISQITYGAPLEKVTFTAAGGQSVERGSGEMRENSYKTWAKRYFGEYYAEYMTAGQGTIIIPEAFRSGFRMNRTFFQMERKAPEIEFGSEESNTLTGHALANNPINDNMSVASNDNIRALEFANKLSRQLGVDYQFVSAREAEELTKNAKNPWKGERSFFVGGRVYFVGEHLSTTMVLHEFAHPLVRAMAAENRSLFNKLFNELANTEDGQAIINRVVEEYADISQDSDIFKEEVIVRALEKAAADRFEALKPESKFNKFINNLLYNMKQLLRKVFGRGSSVANLNPNTTIEELAQMLADGKQFSLETESISQDDVVAYLRDQEQYMNDLQNIKSDELQALVNRVYDIASKHVDTLMSRKDYDELAELLTDEFQRGDLQQIKSRVQEFQTMIANKARNLQEDMEYERQRSAAFIDSMFRLEKVMEKVLTHMQDIAKTSTDTVDNLHKAYYYDYLVKYWENFINEVNEALDDPKNGVPNNSPLNQLVGNISRSISRIKNLTNEMYAEGARDVLYDQLGSMNENIKARYEQMIQQARAKNAPQSRIDKLFRDYYGVNEAEYNQMRKLQARRTTLNMQERNILANLERQANNGIAITPEKIEALLRGEIGDSNFFNSYLEGYLYNTDPVVGGLAAFVKNKMNEVMVGAQAKFNEFANDIQEDLKAAGFNPTNIGELGQRVGFVDTISTRNPQTGEIEERKVWTFLNPFKNYRYDLDVLNDNVEQAQANLAQTGTAEANQKLIDAIVARQEFMRRYMNQEYVAQYYERQALFEQDDIGKKALAMRKNLFERMRALDETANTEIDQMAISDDVDLLWREYRQLHSEYNLDGSRKTGEPLEIAKRLKQYQEASRDFYEWKMRKGVFENAFFQYQQELADQGIREDNPLFETLTQEWLRKNTRVVIKDEYYTERGRMLDRIKEILSRLPDAARKEMDQSAVWEKILDLASGFRDEDGQPNATELSEGSVAEIKRLQQELELMRGNYIQRSGLTANEHQRLNDLHTKKANQGLTQDERMEMADLYNKKNTQGLSKWESAELDALYADLAAMSTREATDYYVDTMNEWLSKMDTDQLFLDTGSRTITKESADFLLDTPHLKKMLADNADFASWFRANHYQKQVFNKATMKMENRWERLYVWNVVRPSDESYIETYDIKDGTGKTIRKVKGVPATKYYARVVKPEFRTKRVVGETVDNRGNWLPKTMEQGAVDDRYMNQEYFELQRRDPATFKLLEKLKEHHLQNQEGLSKRSKLYLDFPRYRKSNLEVLQSKGIKNIAGEQANALTIWAKRTKEFFQGAKDDAESGFNDKSEFDLVRADMFDNEITNVPIHGLYNIDLADVSTDITTSMMRYMLSGERQKQLVNISPVARAIQSVVNDPANQIKELDKVNKFNFIHRGVTTYLTKKGKGVRASAVNNFVEREFEGQRMTGFTKDIPWINNTANLLFKRASFSFFALNIPSALKNSYGAKFQAMIEASAGKDVNHISLQQGNVWSYATMAELSFGGQLYKSGAKSLRQQIVEVFDPVQDRFEERFGESMSRSFAKDMASMSWLYNFRKWVELQASLQIFGGMMYHQKVKMFEGTAQETEIPYMDAWEVRDGKIQLKEGVDPKWGITYDAEGKQQVGSEFKRMRNKIHQKMNDLQGAYAKFDQPEAQRYLAFRFISYLRRYFTTMTLNRFGFSGPIWDARPRFNPGAGDVQMGFYIQFLQFMKNFVTSAGRNVMYMTPDEKAATLRVATEVGMLIAATAAMGLVFGWDPDDEEKYEKLRAKSGALPFPFTSEDPERPFDGGGFLEVHALHLLMNIRSENEQFIPLPGYGLNDYTAMLDLKSIAFGPTLKSYGQLFDDLAMMATGSDKAYYAREAGPYDWQQEGGSKFLAHLATMFGLTGSTLDPAKAVKGFQSAQARAR